MLSIFGMEFNNYWMPLDTSESHMTDAQKGFCKDVYLLWLAQTIYGTTLCFFIHFSCCHFFFRFSSNFSWILILFIVLNFDIFRTYTFSNDKNFMCSCLRITLCLLFSIQYLGSIYMQSCLSSRILCDIKPGLGYLYLFRILCSKYILFCLRKAIAN